MKFNSARKTAAWPGPLLAAGLGLAAFGLSGCSASIIDSIPTWAGGEPQGTPPRSAVEPSYPPVHDRPPPPATKVISEQEEAKIERELAAAREAQAARAKQMQKDRADMLANTPQPPSIPAADSSK
ncbi:MAG TPA: hypothetical protein VFA53_06255 [Xanthobacteraceae bacterium]|nr:hypothetical protein [Xanthobacteraceae bacterium]